VDCVLADHNHLVFGRIAVGLIFESGSDDISIQLNT
jgi:hypothetical protein